MTDGTPEISSPSRAEGAVGTFLLVDDEADIREMVALIAASYGLDMLEAANGKEALDVLRDHRVDAVVSDLLMPRMSGLALLAELRENGFTQPFIVLTGYSSQESTLQALRFGAFDCIEKPFDAPALMSLILEAVRVGRALRRHGRGPSQSEGAAEIGRLSALRRREPPPELAAARSSPDHAGAVSASHYELFVAEAAPQLQFCVAAIKGLNVPETRPVELGYLLRVMQGIATAADAIGGASLSRLATAAATFYATLRVKPRAVTGDTIDLATRTNATLQALVGRHGQQTVSDAIELVRELTDVTQRLEARLVQDP